MSDPRQPPAPGPRPTRAEPSGIAGGLPGGLPAPAGGCPADLPHARLLVELEQVAVAVATAAARLVHEHRPADLRAATKSTVTDPVTVMDLRAEELIAAQLLALRPDDGLLGEEGLRRAGHSGLTWIVDPIDGTTNYLYDQPAYAVSVAAAVGAPPAPGWRPVAGAVAAPVLGTIWSARHGGGARRLRPGSDQPEPIRVAGLVEPSRALVGTGFSYRSEVRAEQARMLGRVLPAVRDIRRLGSAAIDLCLVADGRLDAYYEIGLHPWDLAAGWLIVTEAGGVVTGAAPGSAPDSKLTLAGNAQMVRAMGRLLAH